MGTKLSEALQIVSCIDADAYTAGTYVGDAVDMGSWDRVMYVLTLGDMASSPTVDYSVTGCATSGGVYAGITAGSATQLTQAGTDDNKQVIIEVDAATVKAAGYKFVKDRLLVTTAASDAGTIGLAHGAHETPATDLTTVDEILTV